MLKGLHVSKVKDIGSENQPGPLDLDDDDEAPWAIDWSGPNHPSNRDVVAQWIDEVMKDNAVSPIDPV